MVFLLWRSGPRQHHHRLIGIETADPLQDRNPIHPRHFVIEHHNVRLEVCGGAKGGFAIFSFTDNHDVGLELQAHL